VLELPDADWTGNPVLDLARDELVLTVNGMPVNLQDLRLSMRIQQWGQGFEDGAVQATIDGRELDAALGDRVDSTTSELLDAMGTACRACADGVEACFDVDLASLTGADYSGTFDEEPDPSSCD
jgi:hypothetical protein